MKKIVVFVLLAAFLSACSQYTCPTYTKKEAPKQAKDSSQRI
jgi:peroxiredoxin